MGKRGRKPKLNGQVSKSVEKKSKQNENQSICISSGNEVGPEVNNELIELNALEETEKKAKNSSDSFEIQRKECSEIVSLSKGSVVGEFRRECEKLESKKFNERCPNMVTSELEIKIKKPIDYRILELRSLCCGDKIQNDMNTPIPKNVTEAARLVMFRWKMNVMASPIAIDTIIVVLKKSSKSNGIFNEIIATLMNYFKVGISGQSNTMQGELSEISLLMLQQLVEFTLKYRILQTGEWIHVGEKMEYLVNSQITLPLKGDRTHINAIMFSFFSTRFEKVNSQAKTDSYKIEFVSSVSVSKFFPVSRDDMDRHVYCLPRCAYNAQLVKIFKNNNDIDMNFSTESCQNYWNYCHGYKLHESAFEILASVKFSENLTLTYPASLVQRQKWTRLPYLEKVLENQIEQKFIDCIKDINLSEYASVSLIKSFLRRLKNKNTRNDFNPDFKHASALKLSCSATNTDFDNSEVIELYPSNRSIEMSKYNVEDSNISKNLRNNFYEGDRSKLIFPPVKFHYSRITTEILINNILEESKRDDCGRESTNQAKETIKKAIILPPPATYDKKLLTTPI